jgi:DNA-binding response OmpR family regulator
MKAPIPNPVDLPGNSPAMAGTQNRLLLISDAPERMRTLASAFTLVEVEMTKVATTEELTRSCNRNHDLAIVDVAPRRLTEILKTLRESERHARIPVLVDRSRLTDDGSLASVLPQYRAMPCSAAEIMKLARRRLASAPQAQPAEPRERGRIL